MSDVDPILVVGATGYVGGRLTPRLLAAGHRVRCLTRSPGRLAGRPWSDRVEAVEADVLDPDTLPAALDGIRTAYYLVHSMGDGYAEFEERDYRAARNFARAAKSAGVDRVIYLGGLGHGDGLSPHLFSRQEVGRILAAEGPPVTEFRAAVVVGSGSASFEMIRYLTERLPVMVTPSWVRTKCQPIAVRDALAYLQQAVDVPESRGRVLEIGGREVLSYADMIRGYAKARGLRRLMIPVPILSPTLSSRWVDLVTPLPRSLARPLIEGLKSEVIVRDDSAAKMFNIETIDYARAVELALERISCGEVETAWSTPMSIMRDTADRTRLDSTEGLLREQRQLVVDAPAEDVFHTFMGVGGKRGWLVHNWAWRLRGYMDRLLGGVGLQRGRRDPDRLYPGEVLDWWRVEEVRYGSLLRLRAEMKLPGRGWLQFQVEPEGGAKSRLVQTAFFEPHGLFGTLYWYSLVPAHFFIFRGMIRKLGRMAIERYRRRDSETAVREPAAVGA